MMGSEVLVTFYQCLKRCHGASPLLIHFMNGSYVAQLSRHTPHEMFRCMLWWWLEASFCFVPLHAIDRMSIPDSILPVSRASLNLGCLMFCSALLGLPQFTVVSSSLRHLSAIV